MSHSSAAVDGDNLASAMRKIAVAVVVVVAVAAVSRIH